MVTEEHTAQVEAWWRRFTWLVEHEAVLGETLVARVVGHLTGTAKRLGDRDLVVIAEHYTRRSYLATQPQPVQRRPTLGSDVRSSPEDTGEQNEHADEEDRP